MPFFKHFFHIPMMVHGIDDETKLVFVNQCWLDTLGFQKEEVIGKKCTAFLSDSSKRLALNFALPICERDKEVRNIPFEFISKSGDPVQVLLSASSVFDKYTKQNRKLAFMCNITDIPKKDIVSDSDKKWSADAELISSKLMHLRKLNDVTQDRIADFLGMSLRTYQRIEYGQAQVTIDKLIRIAEFFSVDPTYFFTSDENDQTSQKKTVLIVDDESLVLNILKEELQQWGYKVIACERGEEAFQIIQEDKIDVLISDVIMSDLGGIDLAKRILRSKLMDKSSIIMMSGSEKNQIAEKLGLPDNQIIEKPFDYLKLKVIVKNALPS